MSRTASSDRSGEEFGHGSSVSRSKDAAGRARVREDVLACPACDLLHATPVLAVGEIARCRRCGAVIQSRKRFALDRTLAMSLANLALLFGAVSFPFLSLRSAGVEKEISVIDAVAALARPGSEALAAAAFLFILAAPLARAAAMTLVLGPLRLGRPAARWSGPLFRFALELTPWAMAEVFLIGVVVSLVKVADVADVEFGPSFWAFTLLVVATALERSVMCRDTTWAEMRAK